MNRKELVELIDVDRVKVLFVKDGILGLFGFQVSDPMGLGFNLCVAPALYFVLIFRNIPKFGMVGFGRERRA